MNEYKIQYEGKAVSKSNNYEVRFEPRFWQLIKPIVDNFRRGGRKTYWIAPSDKIKRFETNLSTIVLAEVGARYKEQFIGKQVFAKVTVYYSGREPDTDNLTKSIGDALEKGILKFNDKQIKTWLIDKEKAGKDLINIELTIL